ncbi:hypothetical protein TorRG33x02_163590 [Trema orientale]|uniref:Uncharacterized protein n=1 Tax=Trema orientale TaxID=63057 RepID=A0A2P5EQH5_TREOI|nr:hypothetical protein TorRG33x02_163590 [Trema orientale]
MFDLHRIVSLLETPKLHKMWHIIIKTNKDIIILGILIVSPKKVKPTSKIPLSQSYPLMDYLSLPPDPQDWARESCKPFAIPSGR